MKPHLLFVVPDLGPGGAQPMNLRLARALQARGWPVRVAVLFDRQRVLGEEVCRGLDIAVLGRRGWRGQWQALVRLTRLADEADMVIGGVECAATTYGYWAARKAKRPFVSWTHIAYKLHEKRLSAFERWLSHCIYRKTRWIVFPSQGALDSLSPALGGRPIGATWRVIENFFDPRPIPVGDISVEQANGESPIILGIGRLDLRQKAFDRLVRVHAALLGERIQQRLVIIGDGPDRPLLEKEIARLGVEKTVSLPGHVHNVDEWLARASVFALTSRYEGLPLVLLEALAAGVPVVAMDCPAGPREILRGGEDGILVPEGDEEAMGTAIARLLMQPEWRAYYRQKGLMRARDFSAERIVPKWEELLEQVIAAQGGYHG